MSQPSPVLPDGRKYQILDVIGRGGFGNVYRARLEAGEGFFKDVAIKIARDVDAPAEALERFRDEARILGLIRDRALVDVDPPMRLDGRWAVVMEYVDGASCSRLLVRYGGIPASVCLEIGAEIARVLHKIYKHPGTDGQPLRLVHRDIKPANIQITPSGAVKLLDFGIARAEFRDRESKTVMTIGGTRGYIAPERTTGLESPAGDIYSLGVVLHKLVTGKLPSDDDLGWEAGDPEPMIAGTPRDMVLAMSHKMRSIRPNLRPTAEEVHKRLSEMAAVADQEGLEAWAARVVPEISKLAEDELVGTTLGGEHTTLLPRRPSSNSNNLRILAVILLLGIAAALVWFTPRSAGQEDPPARFTVEQPVQPVAPEPVPVAPMPVEPIAPAPVRPPPRPTVRPVAPLGIPEPAAVPDPVAEPGPGEPEPVEEPAVMRSVRITSIPMGATVKVDGRSVGVTPLLNLELSEGDHRVEIASDQALIRRTIQVGKGLANRFVWRVSTDTWEKGF